MVVLNFDLTPFLLKYARERGTEKKQGHSARHQTMVDWRSYKTWLTDSLRLVWLPAIQIGKRANHLKPPV
jgi:hypothetical protein